MMVRILTSTENSYDQRRPVGQYPQQGRGDQGVGLICLSRAGVFYVSVV